MKITSTGLTDRSPIIGDVTHAMNPMSGSRADTAIRNAANLAEMIAQDGVTANSVAAFEARMTARATEKRLSIPSKVARCSSAEKHEMSLRN